MNKKIIIIFFAFAFAFAFLMFLEFQCVFFSCHKIINSRKYIAFPSAQNMFNFTSCEGIFNLGCIFFYLV